MARTLVPALCGAALRNIGVRPLLDAVVDYLPSPTEVSAVRGRSLDTDEEFTCPVDVDAPLADRTPGGLGLYLVLKMADSINRADPSVPSEFLEKASRQMAEYEEYYIRQLARLMEKYRKPILGVSLLTGAEDRTVYTVEKSIYKSVFYPSPERAVKALSRMVEYVRFLNR